ncbi:unnamed protein product [Brassica rapa subsp. narinosa]
MEWFLLATSVCDGPLNPFLSTRGMSSAVVGLCHVLGFRRFESQLLPKCAP